MVALLLALLVTQGASTVLPYPWQAGAGDFVLINGQRCSLLFWDTSIPAEALLEERERQALEELRREIQEKWEGAEPEVQRELVKRYLTFQASARSGKFLLEQARSYHYQHLRVACGKSVVRGAFLLFPQMAGFALVTFYEPTAASIVVVSYMPNSKKMVEEIKAFWEAYGAELEKLDPEESGDENVLPEEVRSALKEFQKRQEQGKKARITFTDVNGILLPGCPTECPPGAFPAAWGNLTTEERLAFSALLGLLARAGGEDSWECFGLSPKLFGMDFLWPKELGENPVAGFQGKLTPIHPGPLPITFSRPEASLARELFGRENWELPALEGELKDVLKALRRAVR
ncbi:MAG: hypothetical protein ACUVRY_08490 [Thermoanaerobaculaceae bacterium]